MSKEEGIFSARYGGDEFVVIYENMSEKKVKEQAELLRKRIYDANMEHKFSLTDTRVTISQGLCIGTPDKASSFFAYLQGADKMLYEVKQQSRNDIKICKATEL